MENDKLAVVEKAGLVTPGDELSARITDTGKKVLKISKNKGTDKYSITQYKNGTTVETRTKKEK